MNKEEITEQIKDRIYKAYCNYSPSSKRYYERACKSLQNGVIASTRFFEPYPLTMTGGNGSKIYDIDGHEYIDYFLSAGPLMLGYNYPDQMESIRRELDRGLQVFNSELAVECAELIKEAVPCAEKIRFCNVGGEATTFAVRAARAYTGKNKIIKFFGHYHGLDDQFCIGNTSDSTEATSGGIPQNHLSNTVVLKYNDVEEFRHKLEDDHDIACVILDPQMSMGGCWPADREYLTEVRYLTKKYGIVLIFDEIITGFRLALGGAQEYFGVIPDMVALGKGLAAGGKLAAIAGKEEFMKTMTPEGLDPTLPTSFLARHGGTYTDGVIALASAIATLKVYRRLAKQGGYQRTFELAEKLKSGIESVFSRYGVGHVNILGSSLKLFMTRQKPSFEVYSKTDLVPNTLFHLSLIPEGIFVCPSLKSIFVSFVHNDGDAQKMINAISSSMAKYDFGAIVL